MKKKRVDITNDDLHYYGERTGESLPAYLGLGPPRPDELPFIGQENRYTGTVSKNVTYVNFQDEGIMNYTVFHTVRGAEQFGHWHWDTELVNAEMEMRPRGTNQGYNPRMFTLTDGDGSISGDGDYTEYRYYETVLKSHENKSDVVNYRGNDVRTSKKFRVGGPAEDLYITDDCEKLSGSPRLWECESKSGFFTMKPDSFGQDFFLGASVTQESSGESYTTYSPHNWLPVNHTYHVSNGNVSMVGVDLEIIYVEQGDWMAFSFPSTEPFDLEQNSIEKVDSLSQLYQTNSAPIIAYYSDEENRHYVRLRGTRTLDNRGVPQNNQGPHVDMDSPS